MIADEWKPSRKMTNEEIKELHAAMDRAEDIHWEKFRKDRAEEERLKKEAQESDDCRGAK